MKNAVGNVRQNWWRLIFAGVGVVAGIVSYSHIYALVLAAHQSPLNAHLMPVAVDGLIIIGSGAHRAGRPALGWLGFGPGLAASLYANVESSMRYGLRDAIVAGWASVAFFIAAVILERWSPAPEHTEPESGTPAHTPERTVPETVPVPALRELMRTHKVGQPRAREIRRELLAAANGSRP